MLRKVLFDESWLSQVQAFDCGNKPWDVELSEWIKAAPGENGAIDHVKVAKKCVVWLYLDDADNVVGYSSLGSSKWKYPTSDDPKKQINIIPNVAVDSRFQGKGYFTEIMQHLLFEAKQHTDRLPVVGLFVHPSNEKAIDIYHHYGFEDFPHFYEDKQTRVIYRGMIRKIE